MLTPLVSPNWGRHRGRAVFLTKYMTQSYINRGIYFPSSIYEVFMENDMLEKSYIPFQCLVINTLNRFNVEGITTAQYEILDALVANGSKTTTELASLRGISQSGTSKLTKRLLDKNYIVQKKSGTDRRSYDISITPEGRDFLNRAEKFRKELLLTIEAALSEQERETFATLCRKIVASSAKGKEKA